MCMSPLVVWGAKFLAKPDFSAVGTESERDDLVDGMGLEPTTPTLRTWCSPN